MKTKSITRSAAPYLLLLLLVSLVYVNSLANDFVWDDDILIVNNHLIGSWRNVPMLFTQSRFQLEDQGMVGSSYYRPLISLSCVLDYSIWGLHPRGFHLTNVLAHGLSVLLFFHLFKRLFQNERAVLLAALLYAVSPVHTNAVSYIMGRTDLFASVFFLTSIILYRAFRSSGEDRNLRYLVGTLIFFCLSLLCKESAATLPAIAVLYDICFTDIFRRKRFAWKSITAYIPFAVILGVYFLFRRIAVPEGLDFAIHSFSDLIERLATIIVSVASYWKLLLFPVRLSYERNIAVVHSLASPRFLVAMTCIAVSLALMVRWWRHDKKKLFCLLWFFITFAPTSNILPVFPSTASSHLYTAEHFMYLPAMGLFVLAALLFPIGPATGENLRGRRRVQRLFLALWLMIVLVFSLLTIRRTTDWRDNRTFFESSLSTNPSSARMMNNLGVLYLEQKQYEKAMEMFQSTLRIRPDTASAYNNIATVHEDLGAAGQAEEAYRKALLTDEKNIRARLGLGKLLARTGRIEEAKTQFSTLAGFYPALSAAHHELGRLLTAEGKHRKALQEFQDAFKNSPNPDVVANSIGIVYARNGDLERASRYFRQALELNPDSYQAHVNLGNIYFLQNLNDKALEEYEKALRAGADVPAIRERIRELRSR